MYPKVIEQLLGSLILLAALVLTGCGTLEVGIEPTALPVEALAMAIVEPTATATPPAATPAPVDTPPPALEAISMPESIEAAPTAPEAVVEAFYRWYLDYIGDRASGDFRNPLVDRAYRQSDLLTPNLIRQVDGIIAGFDKGGYDPFLCAQDIPPTIKVAGAFEGTPTARVLVYTDFHHHFFTVELEMVQPQTWRINDITCAITPEGVTTTFYTWYLGQSGPAGNSLEEMALFLTPDLAEQIRGWSGGYDPILLAQDLPQNFRVTPGGAENQVIVTAEFSPESRRQVQVTLQRFSGRWLIEAIEPAESGPADGAAAVWDTFVSEEYGVSFAYPAEWVVQAVPLDPNGPPMEPVVQIWHLMPPDIAAALANRVGPPDPTAPVIVPPFNVEVSVGSAEELARYYPPASASEDTTFNGYSVTVERTEPGIARYVFPHPAHSDRWVVVTDWVGEFPGRKEAAEAVAGILPEILSSVTFTD